MNEELEIEDFAKRCRVLEKNIKFYYLLEQSPRVWSAVLSTLLKDIVHSQNDPDGALEQVINLLKEKHKDDVPTNT